MKPLSGIDFLRMDFMKKVILLKNECLKNMEKLNEFTYKIILWRECVIAKSYGKNEF